MIKNPDGTPYNVVGSMQQFDPENRDIDAFNLWDEETIRIGGSPIFYYEVFIQDGTLDPVYLEDRGKIYSNNPVQLYAMYEPIPSKNAMGVFGMDSPDEMIFDLNYRSVIKTLGHLPKVGSRIFTPHLRENWVVVTTHTGEYKLWNVMRIQLLCQRFQESTTSGEGKVSQGGKMPDFKII